MKVQADQVRVGDKVASSWGEGDRTVVKVRVRPKSVKFITAGGFVMYCFRDSTVELEFLEERADVSERQIRAFQVRRGDRVASGQVFARAGGQVKRVRRRKGLTHLTFTDKTTAELFDDRVVILNRD